MDSIEVRSTSNNSAETTELVLRENESTRLLFCPMIVNNPKDQQASVRGKFVFQRKGRNDTWEANPYQPSSTLKAGEGYRLELHAGELLSLFRELDSLYALHLKAGVPTGVNRYVRIPSFIEGVADVTVEELISQLLNHGEAGVGALVNLISWAGRTANLHEVVARLNAVHPNVLHELSASVRLGELRRLREHWKANAANDSEEFWQQLLGRNSFLLEQCFHFPVSVIGEKAYLGGKTLSNTGAQLIDFVAENALTHNIGLVEIKTPGASLLAPSYRANTYPLGKEVSGAIAQVLTYRATLQQNVRELSYEDNKRLEVWAPPTVVVCGTAGSLKTAAERRSFELQRRQFRDVDLICFDELFERLQGLIKLLEASGAASELPADDAGLSFGDAPAFDDGPAFDDDLNF